MASSSPLLAQTVSDDEPNMWHDSLAVGETTTTTTTTSTPEPRGNASRYSSTAWEQYLRRFLQRYGRVVGSSLHRDRLLKTAQYTLWWYGRLIAGRSSSAAHRLSEDVSWARYVTRATEWPLAWEALWTDSWAPPVFGNDKSSSSSLLYRLGRSLGRILAASMVVYYPLEHLAYVHWKALPSSGRRLAEQYSAWSCRAWLLYTLTDIVQGYMALTTSASSSSSKEKSEDDEKDDDHQENRIQRRQRHKQQVALLRNVLFLLPAYHWSLSDWDKRPWLKSTTVNGLMWLEAIVSLYQTSLEVE